jgi:hypothetical protein
MGCFGPIAVLEPFAAADAAPAERAKAAAPAASKMVFMMFFLTTERRSVALG